MLATIVSLDSLFTRNVNVDKNRTAAIDFAVIIQFLVVLFMYVPISTKEKHVWFYLILNFEVRL